MFSTENENETHDVLSPSVAATISLQGLAVCCYNKTYNGNRGRWEVAIPRFDDHNLKITIKGIGTIIIEPTVKFIEIKDRAGVAPDKPTYEGAGLFDPKDKENSDKNDFRWLTNFTNGEGLTHQKVSIITKADNPNRVDVTMMYIYDAVFYTKNLDSTMLIRRDLNATAPLDNDKPRMLEPSEVVPLLEKEADAYFEARTVGIDLPSSGGGGIDILFDKVIATTLPKGTTPREIRIQNLEKNNPGADRFIPTEDFFYGLGDFYRYYLLFKVEGSKSHQWGKQPRLGPLGPGRECCCNGCLVNFSNLDGLL